MTVDELRRYGLETMREEEVLSFLDAQSTGVLGLAADGRPYMVPLSYANDEQRLYFTYLVGKESRKAELTEKNPEGRFLIYQADSPFRWESVLLDGTLRKVPPSEWGDLDEVLADVWRPELFETASTSRHVRIYAFDTVESSGIKQTGLPPGMEGR